MGEMGIRTGTVPSWLRAFADGTCCKYCRARREDQSLSSRNTSFRAGWPSDRAHSFGSCLRYHTSARTSHDYYLPHSEPHSSVINNLPFEVQVNTQQQWSSISKPKLKLLNPYFYPTRIRKFNCCIWQNFEGIILLSFQESTAVCFRLVVNIWRFSTAFSFLSIH